MNCSSFETGIQLTDLKYSAHSYDESEAPFIYASVSLRGFWFRIDFKSLNGIQINGKRQRTKVYIEFPHNSPHYLYEEDRRNGYIGRIAIHGYNSSDDSYDDKMLRAEINLSLPIEMFDNIIQLTNDRFIGFECAIEWNNDVFLSESNSIMIGGIKTAHFVHQISSMYDFTGKIPKKESDHFHYKV